MNRNRRTPRALRPWAGALGALWLSAGASMAAAQAPLEWTFDRPGDLEGWQPNGDLTEVVVTNGVVAGRAVGVDPIFELRPLLDRPASPWDLVEIRLRADRDGPAELFWSNTSTGRHGGFAAEKSTRFPVRGDHQWHIYRLLPGWRGTLIGLRLEPGSRAGAQVELDRVRLLPQ